MILSTVFLALEIVMVLFGVYMGYRRGVGCALVRLVELVLVAIGSLLLGRFVAAELQTVLMSLAMEMAGESVTQYAEVSAELTQLVGGLLGALLVPVFFAFFFWLLKLITLIGFGKLSRRIAHGTTSKVKLEKGSKWGGAFVGLISGMLVAAILLSPIFSYIYIAGNLSEESKALLVDAFELEDGTQMVTAGDRVLLSSGTRVLLLGVNDVIPDTVPELPINELVCRLATRAEGIEGNYSATDAVPELVNMVTDVLNTYTAAVESGDDDLNAIVKAACSAIPHMEGSEFIPEITTSLLNAAGEVLKNGGEIAGLSIDTEDATVKAVLDSFSDVLVNTSTENVEENLKTLIGSDEEGSAPGVLQSLVSIDFSRGAELITDEASANALVDMLMALANNENMSSVMNSIREIGMDAIRSSGIDLFGAEAESAYPELADGLNMAVQATAEEKGNFHASVEDVAALLKDLATEYGVSDEITDPQYKLVSICIVHYFCTAENYAALEAGNTAVTVEEVKAFFGV